MDFLDPKKQRQHMIQLLVGYVLIGVAIVIATVILLYQAYGFGLDKDGEVIQNGLVYVSSRPRGTAIYLNGLLKNDRTNAKLQLPAGDYTIELRRSGYRNWQRDVQLAGGVIEHFDYPLLFPTTMTAAKIKDYAAAPGLLTQSPDHRWLLLQQPGSVSAFEVYDLNASSAELATKQTVLTMPDALVTSPASENQNFKLVEWSTDNRHILLEHTYADGNEYLIVDRSDPTSSINLTQTLRLTAGQTVTLRDKKYDQYYIFDAAAKQLQTASLNAGTTQTPLLSGVLAYKSYSDDTIVYATAEGAAAGKVMTMLHDGDITYKIREQSAAGPYLLDVAKYDGDWFVVSGSGADNKVYVYKNPQSVLKAGKVSVLVPVSILKVTAPTYVAFSSSTQYIVAEGGTNFASYDAETNRSYAYTTTAALDTPATHATWMDNSRLIYVSGGKLVVFDYDNKNLQTLIAADPAYLPYFDRDYETVYTMTAGQSAENAVLSATSLLTAADR